jgi:M6 family metalloprotease-like protein
MKRNLLLILVALLTFHHLLAVPANPDPRMLQQPDGTTFTAVLKGDEHFGFAVTEDGFSVVCDPATGWWSYAQKVGGLLVSSQYRPGRDGCPYSKNLRPDAAAVAALPENKHKMINVLPETRQRWSWDALYGYGRTPSNPAKAPTGAKYVNILLGDFTDSTFSMFAAKPTHPWNPFPPNLYRRMLFLALGDRDSAKPVIHDSTTIGSMSNYFWEMTYNKCYFAAIGGSQIRGVDTVRSSGRTWSNANNSTTTYISSCVSAADNYVNFADPGGGQAGLIIIHPGPGEEESGRTGDIWSASYSGLSISTNDGVTITKAIVCPQNSQLGVFCHEMFHQLGGPDLYDYGYSSNPWGVWSLMDAGSYNSTNISGDAPAFPGGHLQYDIDGNLTNGIDGWLNAAVYTDSISSARNGDGRYQIAALDSCGEAGLGNITSGRRLWRIRNNNFRDSAQVFFVENRRRTPPYEIGLPEEGLVITHIDTRMNSTRLNNGPPTTRYFYSWVESPGFDPNISYNSGVSADTFYQRPLDHAAYSSNDWNPAGYYENRIDSLSIPSCRTNRDNAYGPWIFDISPEGPVMNFSIARTGIASSSPLVGFKAATVLDPKAASAANNGNGILDPWETDSIKVTFYNAGAAISSGAQCSLYVIQGYQYINLTPGWKTIGNGAFASNSEAQSQPFVVQVAKDIPRFYDVIFGLKITGASPAYTDTSSFTLRVSGLNVVFTYNFQDIRVGGTTYPYRIKPLSLAVYRDTLFVANGNLDVSTWQTRIYKVKKITSNNPLQGSDTIASMNNKGATNVTNMYIGGIDVDNTGNLWYSIQDSCYQTTRNHPSPTVQRKFLMPNVSWAGSPMKRIRGVALGPAVVDTVGPDPVAGDSLWSYWQQYNTNASGTPVAGAMLQESLYVIQKVGSGSSSVRYRYSLRADSLWGGVSDGSWWNGRALEYDGSSVWTSSVYKNILIRRNASDARIIYTLPGPSGFGNYGTYGLAHEATDSLGNPYAPVGASSYVPGARGTKHYLYCAAMDEGKIYKIDITSLMLPTPPESIVVEQIGPSSNKVKWWKANVDTHKIFGYIIYRQPASASMPPTPVDSIGWVAHRFGAGVVDSFVDNDASKSPGDYKYSVEAVNYYGYGGWGASAWAGATGVETPLAIDVPTVYALRLRGPNPSGKNGVTIECQLPRPGQTSINIYNLLGERIRTLCQGYLPASSHRWQWDGRDDRGRAVATGIYICRLVSGDYSASVRIDLLK